jgi:hypothetical protein
MCGKIMGQYKQWLQYRKVDQELRTELAHLEQEHQQLTQQVKQLASTIDVSQNTIIQALLAHQQRTLAQHHTAESAPKQANVQPQTDSLPQVRIPGRTQNKPAQQTEQRRLTPAAYINNKAAGTISPALHAWSNLPNLDTYAMQEPIVNARTLPPVPAGQPTHDSSDTLLPADMSAFVDAHSTTDPQLKVPWWLRNTQSTPAHKVAEQTPIDQQSARTNQSVERFFQRWNDTISHPVPEQQYTRQTDQIKPVQPATYPNQQRPTNTTAQIPSVQRPGNSGQFPSIQHANTTASFPAMQRPGHSGQFPTMQPARNTRQTSKQQQNQPASNTQKEWPK